MAGTERSRIPSPLHCNECGNQFEGSAWNVRLVSDEGKTSEWIPATNGAKGNICPRCGSELIGFAHD